MFDKLDDIIYKPIETICDWVKEPLNALSAGRERKKMKETANIEMQMRKQEAELQAYNERQAAELQVDQRRWHAEIDAMIAEQESKRRDQLVESIKRYQVVNSIGMMSIELRREANALIMEKTQEYRQLQDEATNNAMQRLDDINQRFASNERVRLRMEDSVMNQMDAVVDAANEFIKELAVDFKRLNQNTDDLMRMGMQNVNKYLEPMAKSLQIDSKIDQQDLKQLPDSSIVEGEALEV